MKPMIVCVSALGIAFGGEEAPVLAQTATANLAQSRYQIGQMERVLEGAVEHGASVWRERFQSIVPADLLLSENARVRGFRLEDYGVFFDVEVPSIQTAPLWSLRTLDQNDLGLNSALDVLRSWTERAGDPNLQQALKRVELQVAPPLPSVLGGATPFAGARNVSGSPALTPAADPPPPPADRIASDPAEAYRTEVRNALMDAMLDHSRGLEIAPADWLVVAARRHDERLPLAPLDTDARTVIVRVRGSDLTAFLGGQMSRDEARKRMEVKVF